MDLRDEIARLAAAMQGQPQQMPQGQMGPPEPGLQRYNREAIKNFTNPNQLDAMAGAAMGSINPVKTQGRFTGNAAKWFDELGSPGRDAMGNSQGEGPAYLQRLLEEHGVPSRVDGHGNLWAINMTSQGGKASHQWVRLEPTLAAVKRWLGY